MSKLQDILKGDTSFIWGPDLEIELIPENLEEVKALTEYHKAKGK